MKDPELQKIWHALNEAQVRVVLAADELPERRRECLMAALRCVRLGEVLMTEALTEEGARGQGLGASVKMKI
jgi:hypothetical protein